MAQWIRSGTGTAPTSTNTVLTGRYSLDNGTAPADFSPATVTSVQIQYTITGASFVDDTWDNLRAATLDDGTNTAATINGTDATGLQNTGSTTNETDSSPNTGLTKAQWEAMAVSGGTTINGDYTTFTAVMKADNGTQTMSALTVTITYTPVTNYDETGKAFTITSTVTGTDSAAFSEDTTAATPTVVNVGTEYNTGGTDATTHNISLPGSLVTGNTILVVMCLDGQGGATSTDLTEILDVPHSTASVQIWAGYRTITGSEGSTVQVTTALENATGWAAQISDIDPSTFSYSSAEDAGAGTNYDPPNHTPSGGAIQRLWLAAASVNGGITPPFSQWALPDSQYSAGTGGAGSAGGGWSTDVLSDASVNPQTYIGDASQTWVTVTASAEATAGAAGLSFTITSTVTGTDTLTSGTNYDETGKAFTITSTTTGTDSANFADSKSFTVTSTVSSTDTSAMDELNLATTITSTVTGTDGLVYLETGKAFTVTSTITGPNDALTLGETGKTFTITSTTTGTDTSAMAESQSFTITSTFTGTDTLHTSGTNYDETGKAFTVTSTVTLTDAHTNTESRSFTITSTTTGTDAFHTSDSGTFTITSTVTGPNDQYTMGETGLSFTVTSTTTGTDVAAFIQSLAFIINSVISGSDVYTPVGGVPVPPRDVRGRGTVRPTMDTRDRTN